MSSDKMTDGEFAAKVDYEGGITSALEYGLKSEELEEGDLKNLWEGLERLWEQMQPVMREIGALLDGAVMDELDGLGEEQ